MTATICSNPEPAGTRRPLQALAATSYSRHMLYLGGQAQVAVHRYQPATRPGPGPDMVFLHGWGMSPGAYRAGLSAIAAHGTRVDALTLPGYGRSSALPARRCGVDAHAEHLATAIEQGDFNTPVHLTGHSFGGGIALKIAAARPDLVRQVTVVCPAGGAGAGSAPWGQMFTASVREGGRAWADFASSFGPAWARGALSVIASGWDARRADLVADLLRAVSHGIAVHLIVADHDQVAPSGPLTVPGTGARVSVVHGSHTWPHREPAHWAALTLS